jgi:two-component SAPR family response regulator
MRIKTKILFLFVACSVSVIAEESAGGLLFTSSKEKVDKRTSLVVFGDKLRKFEEGFNISFDLSIWDSSQFGHIFRVINNRKQEVEFVFVNFYGTDRMYLDFHSPITHKSVQIPITQEDIDKKNTLHFDLIFDLKSDRASISTRDSVYICEPVGLDNPAELCFAFGLYGLNLDVPQMLIKNLSIGTEKDDLFFFPLAESGGNFASDESGKITATVKNPEWIVNRHFYWQIESELKFADQVNITYNEEDNRIYVLRKDSILCFEPRYNIVEQSKTRTDSRFDEEIFNPDLLHQNLFTDSSGSLYMFGGYSNHSYSDQISVYNSNSQRWELLNFKGDKITPRFYSAVGDGVNTDEKLIFGGFGNESGRQEHGGRNLYDLFLLDLKQKTISHLWTLKTIPETEFIPGNNLILSEDKKSFYALCYAHHIPKTAGVLYRFDLQTGDYEVSSDSILFTSEDMNTTVNLFANKELSEFYAVIRDLTEKNENRVQIYSLLSPPVSKEWLASSAYSEKSYSWLIAPLIALAVLFFGGGFLYLFVFGKKKDAEDEQALDLSGLPNKNEYEKLRQKQSAVYIFGNFTVYDRKGKDISYRFSMKLRTLFSLVLLNTDGETGITTENLTMTLWPDKDLIDGKNIRGVTVNRLRGILEDIDGITLVHQNHQWFFTFEQPFYCDYLEYAEIVQSLQTNSDPEQYPALMDRLTAVAGFGKFLVSVQDSGIDAYKSKEEEKLEQTFREYILRLYAEKQYRKVIGTAKAYFEIEALNAEILNICIKSYQKLGKKDAAKTFLKHYKQTYKKLMGEEYPETEYE